VTEVNPAGFIGLTVGAEALGDQKPAIEENVLATLRESLCAPGQDAVDIADMLVKIKARVFKTSIIPLAVGVELPVPKVEVGASLVYSPLRTDSITRYPRG